MRAVERLAFQKRSFFILCSLVVLFSSGIFCEASQGTAAGNSNENTADGQPSSQYTEFTQCLERSIGREKEYLGQMKDRLKSVQELNKTIETELDAYRTQISASNNLLHLSGTGVADLERAQAAQQSALEKITARLSELKEKRENIHRILRQVEEGYAHNEIQLSEFKGKASKDPLGQTVLKQLQTLVKLLAEEREILLEIQGLYTKQISSLEESQKTLNELVVRFVQQIKEKRNQDLFQRKNNLVTILGWKHIQTELGLLLGHVELLLSDRFWSEQIQTIWKSGGLTFLTSLLLLGIIVFLLFRVRRFFRALQEQSFFSVHPGRRLPLQLLRRSLPLLGATLFIYLYTRARLLYYTVPFIGVAVHILAIWLFTKWGLDFLKLWNREQDQKIPEPIAFHLHFFLIFIRFFAIAYVVLEWMLGSHSVILLLGRVVFELTLLFWSLRFWKLYRIETNGSFMTGSRVVSAARPLIIWWGYAIVIGGFLLELAGYGQLAMYWY